MITEYIVSKCPELTVIREVTPGNHGFSMIDSGGVETEVGEFLYSLIRMVKPSFVLETGTYHGLSSSYIGLALKANGSGSMVTIDPATYDRQAKRTWNNLELNNVIDFKQMSSLDYTPDKPIDVLFLDSEPSLRFDEFVRFFDNVVPGGTIMIHDLHPHLSYNPDSVNFPHWPYGDFRPKLGPYIKDHSVQVLTWHTPRGFTIFQKTRPNNSTTRYLRNEI